MMNELEARLEKSTIEEIQQKIAYTESDNKKKENNTRILSSILKKYGELESCFVHSGDIWIIEETKKMLDELEIKNIPTRKNDLIDFVRENALKKWDENKVEYLSNMLRITNSENMHTAVDKLKKVAINQELTNKKNQEYLEILKKVEMRKHANN